MAGRGGARLEPRACPRSLCVREAEGRSRADVSAGSRARETGVQRVRRSLPARRCVRRCGRSTHAVPRIRYARRGCGSPSAAAPAAAAAERS